ncbi:nucleolar DEAD-box protein required for synthesis of 60S ribosomal subunit [Sorochytrium milnesiophthora]
MAIDFGPGTISDDDDVQVFDEDSDMEQPATPAARPAAKAKGKAAASKSKEDDAELAMNPDFTFSLDNVSASGTVHPWDFDEARQLLRHKQNPYTSIDDKISKRKREQVRDEEDEGDEDGDDEEAELDSDDGEEEEEEEEEAEDDNEDRDQNENDDSADEDDDEEDDEEAEDIVREKRKQEYFEMPEEPEQDDLPQTFAAMNLSRPVIKGLMHLGFVRPTPIQARTIPFGLMGKDICGGAVTGSGKTAAFIIPILERLLYRPKQTAQTRVLVLAPTRELAIQCHSVASKLSQFTDIKTTLCIGGLSTKAQEAELKKRPDIIIATPGRLIDHIQNSPSFSLDSIEILVMDEADRMLEDGFAAELNEIVKNCPKSRQTMLFSATMTDNVDELIRLSLNHPVRLFVDPNNVAAQRLTQEFVRVRAQREEDRPAILLALCKRSFKSKCIVFFRSKASAHTTKILFGLCGLQAAELHGNLTQEQRLDALEKFRDGQVDFLLATDLASRGLDIKGIETVINYNMPAALVQYLHRVGLLKNAPNDQVKHRVIPHEVVKRYIDMVAAAQDDIAAVLEEETEEKELRRAEMEVTKANNMMEHAEEIRSRPARTWFQSEKEKAAGKALSAQDMGLTTDDQTLGKRKDGPKRDKTSGLSRRKKRRLQLREEDLKTQRTHGGSIKAAKKSARPARMSVVSEPGARSAGAGAGAAAKSKRKSKKGFDSDMSSKRTSGLKSAPSTTSASSFLGKSKKGRSKSGAAGKTFAKVKNKQAHKKGLRK